MYGKDASTCSLNAGIGSQTSREQSVTTGTAVGRDWPCPTLLCPERVSIVTRRTQGTQGGIVRKNKSPLVANVGNR